MKRHAMERARKKNHPVLTTAALVALACMPTAVSAQWLDFAQFDVSKDTRTLVLVKALRDSDPRPDPLINLNYTRWETGAAAGIGYTHRWALTTGPHSWLIGAGVGVNHFERRGGPQDDEKTRASLRAQTEISGPLGGGRYYGLLQASTFRSQTFILGQYDFGNSPFGVELSRLRESEHRQTGAAVRFALDSNKRWFLRGGVVRTPNETQPFVGLAFNGF